jgi:hypothetical protein
MREFLEEAKDQVRPSPLDCDRMPHARKIPKRIPSPEQPEGSLFAREAAAAVLSAVRIRSRKTSRTTRPSAPPGTLARNNRLDAWRCVRRWRLHI